MNEINALRNRLEAIEHARVHALADSIADKQVSQAAIQSLQDQVSIMEKALKEIALPGPDSGRRPEDHYEALHDRIHIARKAQRDLQQHRKL